MSPWPEHSWSSRRQLQRTETLGPPGTLRIPQGQSQMTLTMRYIEAAALKRVREFPNASPISNSLLFSKKKKKK